MNYFFILGSPDPEMMEIERVLQGAGKRFSFATWRGSRVASGYAYDASGVRGLIPRGHRLVFIECAVIGLLPDEICDHHNEGDPGYGMPPEQYLNGSSLGQVLALLGIEPSAEQRLIAAADHCLRHAYAGKCPGVDRARLAEWREHTRAQRRGMTPQAVRERIAIASEALKSASKVRLAEEEIAFFAASEPLPDEVREASARLGMGYCYERRDARRVKGGIMGASAAAVEAWMANCGLQDIYGDPARGFAGGYGQALRVKCR